MRIAIVGSRDYPEIEQVGEYIHKLARENPWARPTIVSGGARGVDTAAAAVARSCGFDVEVFPAHWRDGDGSYNRAAGIERNKRVVRSVDRVVAFWDGESRGTRSTIDAALALGIDVEVIFP